jgi:hypothetical protein
MAPLACRQGGDRGAQFALGGRRGQQLSDDREALSSIGATLPLKKTLYAEGKGGPSAPARADVGNESSACLAPQKLVFIDGTCTSTDMVRQRGRSPRGERPIGYARCSASESFRRPFNWAFR